MISLQPGDYSLVLQIGPTERRYLVYVPPGYDGSRPVPLVLMFHGAGRTEERARKETGWAEQADQAGFLAVFPEGIALDPSKQPAFRRNPQVWDSSPGHGAFGRPPVDDVGFVSALLGEMQAGFTVDPRRIFVTGFSNGGSFAFRLGAELGRRIAAIAPVACHCPLTDPVLERPVSAVYLIGTRDPLVPLEGGVVRSPWTGRVEQRPPVRDTILRWARALGCPIQPRAVEEHNGVTVEAYGPGRENAEMLFYMIEGLGHFWPGARANLPEHLAGKPSRSVRGAAVIWDFFAAHPLP